MAGPHERAERWRRGALTLLAVGFAASVGASGVDFSWASREGAPSSAAAVSPPMPPAAGAPAGGDTHHQAPRAPATEVRLAPSQEGRLGAWLIAGPFPSPTAKLRKKPAGPAALVTALGGIDEARLVPELDAVVGSGPKAPRWKLASSASGPIDLQVALGTRANDVIAYAGGVLHVESAARYYLLLGADDGVHVIVDGEPVFTRDDARGARGDMDLVPLDLAPGDHPLVIKLHQRAGTWVFRARLVDAEFAPPVGAYLALPGTTATHARELASKMASVTVVRGVHGGGYRPRAIVRFLEGAPRGVPLSTRVRLAPSAGGDPFFDVDPGEVPINATGPGELEVTLPPLEGPALASLEDADWTYEVRVLDRVIRAPFRARKAVRDAIGHADRALASLSESPPPAWLPPWSLDSVRHLRDRLAKYVDSGDTDVAAQLADARELEAVASALDSQKDPYATRTGPMRRAYVSPIDERLSEFGLYVPPGFKPHDGDSNKPARRYPLVVALHGMRGRPMQMLRWVFGLDDPKRDGAWEDRHPSAYPYADAFVIAPDGHGDAMYRDLGEEDVMRVVEWALETYPIDPTRVTITGPSMGGTGTAAIAFHHPSVFAAAEPLCGYHSYFLRRDMGGYRIRPWEKLIAEERSNVEWAENGQHIPLWIVHGTKDRPEANSGVLIERYEKLGYSVKHDHPDLGHNVWQPTYADLKGIRWLLRFRRNEHPESVRFKTVRPRFNESAWVHVDELASPDAWGEVTARVRGKTTIEVTTRGIAALTLDRDEKLVDPEAPVTVTIDRQKVTFGQGEPLALHKEGSAWRAGAAVHAGPWKKGEISGPIRDIFHAPITFVYGADDPAQVRVNQEVARAWARVGYGVRVDYPMMSDAEFMARGEPLANDRALFLVGNARSNRVVRELESDFPIRIEGDQVAIGARRIQGEQLGAAFIRPNPRRPDRYVVVVEGVDAVGTWRSLSLPNLLPDFIVYDKAIAPSHGQMVLGAGVARAAGYFENDWSLPSKIDDPAIRSR